MVLEATVNAWTWYDQLAPLVHDVKIAHPLLVKLISAARVKTDTRDTLHLARLLAAGLIPAIWAPPPPVRELRMLVAHRQRLVRQRTQAANRLHSVLHAHQIAPPPGRLGSSESPKKPYARAFVIGWNLVGVADFMLALTTGLMYIRPYAAHVAAAGISTLYLNYVFLIPTFAIPLLVALHVYSLAQMISGRRERTRHGSEAVDQPAVLA